ncbi:hypothetical protein D3C80_1602010 [compost metagenome]
MPHSDVPSAALQPAKNLGGADCSDDFTDPGQPDADLHHLRQWRTNGRHHLLRSGLTGDLRQCTDRRHRVHCQRTGALYQGHRADHLAAEYSFQDLAQPENPYSPAAPGHLDRPLVNARSVCYCFNDVAGESRPIVIFYYGAGSLLFWVCGYFNYSCRRVAG